MGDNDWKLVRYCVLIGIISIIFGVALYYGEVISIQNNPLLPDNLPIGVSLPAFLVGVIFIVPGIIALIREGHFRKD